MSQNAAVLPFGSPAAAEPSRRHRQASFVSHAKLIGLLTLFSRILGMARESIAANYFGAGAVWSAFTVAFTIPNLFRKLFGEGALSAAFIPLYAQAVKREEEDSGIRSEDPSSQAFAAASVNLLCSILIALTIVGEVILYALTFLYLRPDYLLAVKLTAIMLPYVLLVCGTAFLGAILQVHHRFAAITATSIVLNACLIVAIVAASRFFNLKTEAGQEAGVRWLSYATLIAGVIQILMLLPSLRAVGFRFQPILHFWTPAVRRMLTLTLPVALSAGVLQVSVVLDKGISFMLARSPGHDTFTLLGRTIALPMAEGAAARLNWSQFLYQFPLGVFAIALATAIFPKLSADALDADRTQFKRILRQGIEASLLIGLPASAGMILVRYPAVRLLFERGNFTYDDTVLVARSTAVYAGAIWAFSLQQILNRAYYSLHDTTTPLLLGLGNLAINTLIELPLLWYKPLAESGMAVGTLVAFSLQAVLMTWMLGRKVGGLGLRQSMPNLARMLLATAAMCAACYAVQWTSLYPKDLAHSPHKLIWLCQLTLLMLLGGGTYFATAAALGLPVLEHVRVRKP